MTTTEAREYLARVAGHGNIYAGVATAALEAGRVDLSAARGQWSAALLGDLGIAKDCGLVSLANRMSARYPA